MNYLMTQIRARVSRFNKNQKGLETLQVVLIIAVAAIILSVIVSQWPKIRDDFLIPAIESITSFSN